MGKNISEYRLVNENNEFDFDYSTFEELNRYFTKDEIKKHLSDLMENMELPYREISLEECLESFKKLESKTISPVEGKWVTRYDLPQKYPVTDLYFPIDSSGNKASDFFHQAGRWKCDSINAPSAFRTWNTEKFRLTLLNALWTMKPKVINNSSMRTIISLRKYIASQFRPTAAKGIYEHFGAKNVLDFSSGWGDRLVGFCASSAESYTGVDPNKNLFPLYEEQKKLYGNGKSIEMINACAEDVDYDDRAFDFVFTSPPYFNIERYVHEDTQSFKRYRKLDKWLEEFLFSAIENAWNHLENNGHMVINISDVYSNHTVNRICEPMNDFISGLSNASFYGCYGYQMAKRPNSKSDKKGVFCEPMWIWKKIDFDHNL